MLLVPFGGRRGGAAGGLAGLHRRGGSRSRTGDEARTTKVPQGRREGGEGAPRGRVGRSSTGCSTRRRRTPAGATARAPAAGRRARGADPGRTKGAGRRRCSRGRERRGEVRLGRARGAGLRAGREEGIGGRCGGSRETGRGAKRLWRRERARVRAKGGVGPGCLGRRRWLLRPGGWAWRARGRRREEKKEAQREVGCCSLLLTKLPADY